MTANRNAMLVGILALGACRSPEADFSASVWYVTDADDVSSFDWQDRHGHWHSEKTWTVFRMRAEPGLRRWGPATGVTRGNVEKPQRHEARAEGTFPLTRSSLELPQTILYWRGTFASTSPYEGEIDERVITDACDPKSSQPGLVHYWRNGRDVVVCPILPKTYTGLTTGFAARLASEDPDTLVASQFHLGHTVVRCEILARQPSPRQIDAFIDSCSSVNASSCTLTTRFEDGLHEYATCD